MTARHRTHRLGTTQAAGLCLVAVALLYHIPLGDTLAADALHAFGAAAVALACAWLSGTGKRQMAARAGCGRAMGMAALCLLAALAGMLAATGGTQSWACGTSWGDALPATLLVALSCLATAIWEEAFFRGLASDAVAEALAPSSQQALKAACVCAAVFALLHMGQDVEAAQGALRFAQVFLFGLAMSGLRAQTGTLGWAVGTHAAYDIVCFLPVALAWQGGDVWAMPASALAAAEVSMPGMLASLVFLLPAAGLAVKALVRR